jgi:UDP-N-acetylglucosamine:LPS N-acetylglucosamine transferase
MKRLCTNKISKSKIKICFAASSGGHYEQLMMLEPIMKAYKNSFIISEKTMYFTKENQIKAYLLPQINRKEKHFIWSVLKNCIISIYVYQKEKPNVIISLGALVTIPMSLIVKIRGGKIIYIESIAKVTSPTLTGKFLYKFADRFYVQWKSMLRYYPNAIYIGNIY